MARLIPLDYDPFGDDAGGGASGALIPLDFDPFEEETAAATTMGARAGQGLETALAADRESGWSSRNRAPAADTESGLASKRREVPARDAEPPVSDEQRRWDGQSFVERNIENPLRKGAAALNTNAAVVEASRLTNILEQVDKLEDARLYTDERRSLGGENREAAAAFIQGYARNPSGFKELLDYYRATEADPSKKAEARAAIEQKIEATLGSGLRSAAEGEALPDDPAFKKAYDEGVWALGKYLATNPGSLVRLSLESAPQMAPGLLMAGAGPAGMGFGSLTAQFGGAVLDSFRDAGVDTTNAASLKAALADPEIMGAARESALKYGVPVALFDGLSAGVAGKMVAPARIAGRDLSPAVREGVNLAAQSPLQGAMGGLGEATGQYLSTGQVDSREVLLEGVAEMGTAPVEVAAFGGRRAFENLRSATADEQRAAPITPPSPDDEASPIPTDMIQRGKQRIANNLAGIPDPVAPPVEEPPKVEPRATQPAPAAEPSTLDAIIGEQPAAPAAEPPAAAETWEPLYRDGTDEVIGEFNPTTGDTRPVGAEPTAVDSTTAEPTIEETTQVSRETSSEPADSADADLLKDFPPGYRLQEGRGQLGKGRWAVVDEAGKSVWNYEASKEEAVTGARSRMADIAASNERNAAQTAREQAIATRIRGGEQATDEDLTALDLKGKSRFDYISPVVQRMFGISNRKVREAMGDALRLEPNGMNSAEYWYANTRKALANAAAWAERNGARPQDSGSPATTSPASVEQGGAVEQVPAAKPVADLTATDVRDRFAAAKTLDEWHDTRVELWEARPDLRDAIVDAMDSVPRPADPDAEQSRADTAAMNAESKRKAQQVADYIAAGGKVTLNTNRGDLGRASTVLSKPEHVRVGNDGLYVARGRNWDFVPGGYLDALVAQVPQGQKTAETGGQKRPINTPDEFSASAAPQQLDVAAYLPRAREFVAGKKPLSGVGKALGLTEQQASRVMYALAGEPNSGIRVVKGSVKKDKLGNIIPSKQVGTFRRVNTRKRTDFATFVAEMGGVRDDEGHDLKRGRNLNKFIPGVGRLIRDGGNSIDEIGEAAWEAGYFGPPDTAPRPGTDQVLDMLERAVGQKVYQPEVQAEAAAEQEQQRQGDTEKTRRADIKAYAKELGEILSEPDTKAILGIMDENPNWSAEQAVDEYTRQLSMNAIEEIDREYEGYGYGAEPNFDDVPFDETIYDQGPDERPEDAGEVAGSGGGREDQAGVAPAGEARGADAGQDRGQAAADGPGPRVTGTDTVDTADGKREQGRLFSGSEDRATPPKIQPKAKQQAADEGLFGRPQEPEAETAGMFDEQPATKSAPQPAGRIEDFGEKIEGARKDVWTDWRTKLEDAKDYDIAVEPFSKLWPEPDYQRLIDEGADKWSVAFVRAARDMVPVKPRVEWKLKGWAAQMTLLRSVSSEILSGAITKDRIIGLMADNARYIRLRQQIEGIVDLYLAVGHEKSLRGVKLESHAYSMYGGVTYSPPRTIWEVTREAKATAFSNFPQTLAKGDTREEAIAEFKRRYDSIDTQPAAAKQISFSIYSRNSKRSWIVGKKMGNDYVDLETFDDVKAARAYLQDNYDALVAKLNRYKDIPNERRNENQPRVGVDHRNGADVTPQQFADTFGFRGVQFGNYVEGPRRQQDLNDAYDALMDLAGIIEVPARALSLNGKLALAFGARGTGGKNPAAAHYERGSVVINLTKTKGAGSLAHEWWHALDNYFSAARRDSDSYLSEKPFFRGEGVRPEMVEAFANIMKAVNQTSLKMRAGRLDKRRTKAYWSTGREMTARAFESYIIAKLADNSQSNDYLANIVSEDYWRAATALGVSDALGVGNATEEETYPYPTAAEVPVIRAAYDEFFRTIEYRQADDGNVPLFSRRAVESRQYGIPKAAGSVDPAFSRRETPFYSPALRAAETLPQAKGNGLQMLALLRKQPGVKEEELSWLGVQSFLGDRKGVTREELADYIRQNQVEVREVVKGAEGDPEAVLNSAGWEAVWKLDDTDPGLDGWAFVDPDGNPYSSADRIPPGSVRDAALALENGTQLPSETKFASYTLPGGENYRELLLTLPERGQGRTRDDWAQSLYNRPYSDLSGRQQAEVTNAIRNSDTAGNYTSGHWYEPNVLAHIRFNDRTDADGKRVLFIEEIQSDWHQQGRKQGYQANRDGWEVFDTRTGNLIERLDTEAEARQYVEDRQMMRNLDYGQNKAGVPDAPLKKTWQETAFRRAVAWAAENGYDRVAWTTGEQQAARYDLSKVVDQLGWTTRPTGGKFISLALRGNVPIQIVSNGDGKILSTKGGLDDAVGKTLDDVFGKEPAERILTNDSGELADLQVGGAGMKGFYDGILPTYANKFGKRFGAKVGKTKINISGGKPTQYADFDAYVAAKNGGADVHSMDITPAMRETVQREGVPLFKKPGADVLSTDFIDAREAVYADFRGEMDRVGLGKVDLRVENSIFTDGKGISFSQRPGEDAIDGFFWRNTIGVALDSAMGARWTLRHEIIHGLRSARLWNSDYGLFRKAEWDTLERAARADRDRMAEIRQRYADLTEVQQVEEAIADMYADWVAGRMEARGFIRTAFERIKAFLEALGNALRGNGFQTADDVFARIESGEFADRADGGTGLDGEPLFARRKFGIPEEAGRPVVTFVGEGPMKRHPDYAAAKSGDPEAAARLVTDLVIPQQFAQARSRFGKNATYVPVIAEEATGKNFIPPALARLYAEKAGGTWTDQIIQTNRVYHTGAKAMPRMVRRAEFAGVVEAGKRYVLVDDMAALGGTFAELANHIRSNGGEVAGLVLLATHKNSEQYAANPSTVAELEEKFGDIIREELDYEPAALTGPEAEHLNSLNSADALRDRISAARGQGDGGGSGSNPGEAGEVSPQFSRRGTGNLFNTSYGAPQRSVAEELFTGSRGLLGNLKAATSRTALGESFDRWRFNFQDRFIDLKDVQRDIAKILGRDLAAKEDPYLQEELMTGRIGARMDTLAEDMVAPLVQGIADNLDQLSVNITRPRGPAVTLSGLDLLEEYLYARHAPERNRRIEQINPDFQPGEGSGMTDAEAARVIDDIRAAGALPAVEAVAAQVDKILAFSVKTRVDAGLLSQQQADAWRAQYKHYVPLRGFAELDPELADERPNLGGTGLTVKGPESRRALGRSSRAADIVAHAVVMAQEAIIRAERNEVGKALYNLVAQAPNPDFWEADKVEMRATWDDRAQQVVYRPVTPVFGADADYTVTLKIDGKEHRITFNRDNPKARRLADSMRNLSGQDFAAIVSTLGKVNRFLSAVNTSYNPEFVITNAFRDAQTGLINLGQYDVKGLISGTVKDYPAAMKGSIRGAFGKGSGNWGKWYDEFVNAGGRVYYNQTDSVQEMQKRLLRDLRDARSGPTIMKALRSAARFIENANQGVEGAIRLAAYKNAREAGMPVERAASLAKNLTVNFNRRGKYGPVMNSLYLFYNASIQGSATMLMAMRSRRVQKVLAGAVGMGVALTAYNLMAGGDDDDGERHYDKISDFDKERNLIIMSPDGSGKYIKIPLPYGYNVFPGIGRTMVEILGGRDAMDAGGSLATTIVDAFNPVGGTETLLNFVMPTIFDPLVDLYGNRDFAGQKIAREREKGDNSTPNAQLYWSSVRPVWKSVTEFLTGISGGDDVTAGAIDINPEHLEYLFGVVTGAAGGFIDRNLSLAQKMIDPTSDVTMNDFSFARKLVGGENPRYDRDVFYDRANRIDNVVERIKKYRSTGRAEQASSLRRENAGILRLERRAKTSMDRLADIRKQRARAILLNEEGKMDRDVYRSRIESLKEREKRIYRDFNAAWIRVEESEE